VGIGLVEAEAPTVAFDLAIDALQVLLDLAGALSVGDAPGEEEVENAAEGVDIGGRRERALIGAVLLGGHESEASPDRRAAAACLRRGSAALRGSAGSFEADGQSEVGHLRDQIEAASIAGG